MGNTELLVQRRHSVLRAQGIRTTAIEKYALCDILQKSRCGHCSKPPLYHFLNYGFLMGPVRELQLVLKFVLSVLDTDRGPGIDQAAARAYMFLHPNVITLDYSGGLTLALHRMDERILKFR